MTALYHAQSAAMVDLLCSQGADTNSYEKTMPLIGGYYYPIHTAANAEVVRALVKHGADIARLGGAYERTAMHVADTPEIVDALMECGGQDILNQRDTEGNTPLDLAGYGSKPNDISVRRCLEKHGAKEGRVLDQEHAKLVAAKKADASVEKNVNGRS